MATLKLLLLVIGIICLFLSGLGINYPQQNPRINFMALGFAFIACALYLPI